MNRRMIFGGMLLVISLLVSSGCAYYGGYGHPDYPYAYSSPRGSGNFYYSPGYRSYHPYHGRDDNDHRDRRW
jgi:hypothetical protein